MNVDVLRIVFLTWLLAALSACDVAATKPSSQFDGSHLDFTNLPMATVAVLPFDGMSAYARPAGEWFAHHLRKPGHLEVLTPGHVEVMLDEQQEEATVSFDDNADAAMIGRMVGADLVALGRVSLYEAASKWSPGTPWRASCELKLIRSSDGREALSFTTTAAVWEYRTRHPYVMLAVEEASVEVLQGLSDRNDGKSYKATPE
jgi:hypothetical protein